MNWKIATLGLGSVMVLLAAFSLSSTVMGFTGGTIHVSIPEAELNNVSMYGGSYNDPGQEVPVVVQKVDLLECPQGQVITRTIDLEGGLKLVATISMDWADMSNVLMKAANLSSSEGMLNGVDMTVEAYPKGLCQTIKSGNMSKLETDIYFVSMGQLSYNNLGISIGVQQES
jgi:hypothetical protein